MINMHATPYNALVSAFSDPESPTIYLARQERGETVAYDIVSFGTEWLNVYPSAKPEDQAWYRWEQFAPFQIIIDGDPA